MFELQSLFEWNPGRFAFAVYATGFILFYWRNINRYLMRKDWVERLNHEQEHIGYAIGHDKARKLLKGLMFVLLIVRSAIWPVYLVLLPFENKTKL